MSRERSGGIGLRAAALLVAGNMIGVGAFTTSGFALADLGSPTQVIVAWVVGGAIALCGALSYAGIAARLPGNGGEYLFLSRAVHPLLGFLAGWVSLFAGFTAPIAVAAHGLEAYLAAALGLEGLPAGLGALAILACGLLHAASRAGGLRLQSGAVAAKLVAIVLFLVLGALAVARPESGTVASTASPPPFQLPAFAVTLVWISFAYSGWNAAVYVAGELDRPTWTLPRALVLGTVAVSLFYVALNAVFVLAAPVEALAGRADVGAVAAEAIGGAWARTALAGIVALGLFTSISAMVMVGPRVYAQMASDGLLPSALAGGDESPRAAIALQVALSVLAYFVADLRALLDYAGFMLGLSAAATVATLFLPAVRRLEGPPVWGAPLVPLVFIGATLGSSAFLVMREPREAAVGLGTVVVGAAVYALMRRERWD
ncbi:MAG: amino acid permease [bacterium]|nr:amino acid permease [bacterium]